MLLFITSNKQKHQQKGCLLRAAGNSFFTLPSFLYWEVCEPVQSHIVACLHNHDNIFILPAFTFWLCIFNYRMPTGTVKKPFFHVPVVPELWQKSLTRLHDHFIKYHKHRRQYKDNHDHTDDRTSRHQDTQ